MGSEENVDRGFQQNCPPNRVGHFYGSSNWDPIVSLSQGANFGNSSNMVPQNEFGNPHCLENQIMGNSSHMVHFPSDSGLVDMVTKIPSFASGGFSDVVSTFGQIAGSACHSNFPQNPDDGMLAPSPYGKRKRKVFSGASPKDAEGEQQKDQSGDTSEIPKEEDEMKQNISPNSRSKQAAKQAKDSSTGAEPSKEDYIHVRAKRGQATNSHSLAERVRREKISERMRLLQELVPGCNKITGKAVMLDEIINYVQSLQQQVEFLSMKLATVNPELNVDIDRILSKDILHLRSNTGTALGTAPGMSSAHAFPGYTQGAFNTAPGSTPPPFHSLPPHIWNSELQGLLQMGLNPDPSISGLGPTGM